MLGEHGRATNRKKKAASINKEATQGVPRETLFALKDQTQSSRERSWTQSFKKKQTAGGWGKKGRGRRTSFQERENMGSGVKRPQPIRNTATQQEQFLWQMT